MTSTNRVMLIGRKGSETGMLEIVIYFISLSISISLYKIYNYILEIDALQMYLSVNAKKASQTARQQNQKHILKPWFSLSLSPGTFFHPLCVYELCESCQDDISRMHRGRTQQKEQKEAGTIRVVCVGGWESWKSWGISEQLQSNRQLQLPRSQNMDFVSLSSQNPYIGP